MSGRFVIMGSGETTPTMVTPHQRIVSAVGDVRRAHLLDTPYGFQENADELTDKTVTYFEDRVQLAVEPLTLRRADAPSAVELETTLNAVRDADWFFCGPGSPSYLLAQWSQTSLPDVLRDRIGRGVATIFASAAAVTLGRLALPVYEIYKVGQDPYWLQGLDLTGELGWDCVVVPHFDNAEGGTHDTSCCYVGDRRLRMLEDQLPPSTWILGVDEHTAAVIDPDERTLTVVGRGGVTARYRDRVHRWPTGETIGLDEIPKTVDAPVREDDQPRDGRVRDAAATWLGRVTDGDPGATAPTADAPAAGATAQVDDARAAFDAALAEDDAITATEQALQLETALRGADVPAVDAVALLRSMITRLGRIADAGLHDHGRIIAPHVDHILDLRQQARKDGRYDEADAIRDALVETGIEVKDTPEGPTWSPPEDL